MLAAGFLKRVYPCTKLQRAAFQKTTFSRTYLYLDTYIYISTHIHMYLCLYL